MSKKGLPVAIKGDVVVGPGGKPRGVFLSMKEYKKMQALLDDLIDIDWIESRAADGEVIDLVDVKRTLKADGLI